MHYLYIIYSESLNKYYIDESPDIIRRLDQHNKHYFQKSFTKAANDWKFSLTYQCENKIQALFLEKFIKRMKSRIFIEKIIGNPHILSEILKKM